MFLYYGNAFYDISPLATAITSCTFTSTTGSPTVTINKTSHGLESGRYITFSSVTLPGGGATGYTTTDFEETTYEVITASSNSFTINKTSHGLESGRYITFSSVTLPGGGATGYTTTDFEETTYEVITASSNSFTITMASNESGTGMTAAGSTSVNPYEEVGPTFQTAGYGWSTSTWVIVTGKLFELAVITS